MPVFALTSRPLNIILQARDLRHRRMQSGQVQPKNNITPTSHLTNNSPNKKNTQVPMANIITPPPKPQKTPTYIF